MKQFDPIFFTPPTTKLLRRLFKGGGGGSSTQTVQNFSPEEAAQRARVQAEASRVYDGTAGTIASSPYPGAQVVPYSADTLIGQGLARTGANTMASQTLPQMGAATKFGLGDVLDVNSNPYLQSTIAASIRPITESYTDPNGVLSNIRSSSMQDGGQGTSTRQGIAEGVAAGRYANAIGDAASKVATDGYGKGLDTFSRIYGLAPQYMNSLSQPGQTYSAVGSQNETMRQAQEGYAAETRNWDLNSQWVPLQNWSNIVYGGTGPSGSTTTSSGGGQRSNPLMGALGGALSGYGLATSGMVAGSSAGAAMGSWAGPIGAIGGAILGGLFS